MRRFVSLVFSLLILSGLYWYIDIYALKEVLLKSDSVWLMTGIGMVIPITMLTALRLVWMVPGKNQIRYLESLRLILAASVMNMVLPSKMGDLAKSLFMVRENGMSEAQSLSLVMFEKISDLLALLFWCALGLFFVKHNHWIHWLIPFTVLTGLFLGFTLLISTNLIKYFFWLLHVLMPKRIEEKIISFEDGWIEMQNYLIKEKTRFGGIMIYSLFLWLLHLSQIWIFIMTLNVSVPYLDNLALAPLAILIGLLPFTLAGIGTRDAAFVFIFSSYFTAATGAALGLMATTRYIVPAIIGTPFFSSYVHTLNNKRLQSKN